MLFRFLALALFSLPAPSGALTAGEAFYKEGRGEEAPIFSLKNSNPPLLFAKQGSFETFDPFVDYNEFQDVEMEREGIKFLKTGRLLTLSVFGGYEGMTFSMRRLYGDALLTAGAAISFFFDLQLAMQLGLIFPRKRYLSILQTYPSFSSYYLDFKYYFSKQNLIKGLAFLNPYLIFGPFLLKVRGFAEGLPAAGPAPPKVVTAPAAGGAGEPPKPPPAGGKFTKGELDNVKEHSKAGFKAGLGIETPLFKKAFIGLEISYSYVPLPFHGQDLSFLQKGGFLARPKSGQQRSWLARLVEPAPPLSLQGKRFNGNMINGILILGINF